MPPNFLLTFYKGGPMKEKTCCLVCKVVGVLVIVGAINWGLIGFCQYNLVGHLLGETSMISRVIYSLVGIAGVVKIISCFKCCPCQKSGQCSS